MLTPGEERRERGRALFGDEREDYAAALERHYAEGPPNGWQERHVSAYATMHPAEDWAETFAHYLHMRDTSQTAAAYGVEVSGPAVPAGAAFAAAPRDAPESFDELMAGWLSLSYALNAINRSMGLDDLYPFVLAPAVVEKLRFVDQLIRETVSARAQAAPWPAAASAAAFARSTGRCSRAWRSRGGLLPVHRWASTTSSRGSSPSCACSSAPSRSRSSGARRAVPRSDWPLVALLGVIWMAVPFMLFSVAQQDRVALAGMINAAAPLFTALIGAVAVRHLPGRLQAGGLVIGFLGGGGRGLAVVREGDSTGLGIVLVLLATILYGCAFNLAAPLQRRNGALPVIWRAQLVALVLLLPVGTVAATESTFAWESLLPMVALGSIGTALAYVWFTTLVGRVGATRGSVTLYFIPVVAILLGALVLDESIAVAAILSTALVLCGAYLTSRQEPRALACVDGARLPELRRRAGRTPTASVLEHVHPGDEAILEPVAVTRASRSGAAALRVVHDLMHLHRERTVRLLADRLRLDPARDRLELARPIGPHGLTPVDAPTLPGVGPVDVGCNRSSTASMSRSLKAR